MTGNAFDYATAFSRNIGWVTEQEQTELRSKRVAIAGLGGVGGSHLLTLARLGITKFNIADPDEFELVNFNRQTGATESTIGRPKAAVMAERALDVNPAAEIKVFREEIRGANLSAFFADVDLYIDALDFFAFAARELVFAHCARHGIPAVTVAPLGMSAALVSFLPGRMTFEDYFQLAGRSAPEKALRFFVGLAPAGLHRKSLVDASRIDLKGRKGPSTVIGCELCAGVAGAEALKLLLKRGKVWAAPFGVQFDGYTNRVTRTWRPGGNRHPLNRLAIALAKRQLRIN